ncbi:MAG: metal ABC transporter substrate-binding protein [Caldisericaceae bacterium]
MKKLVVFIVLFTLLISFSNGCSKIDERFTVGVSIYPFYDAVKSIGGDYVNVILIVPVGSSPHTFTLTPKLVESLSKAKVIFVNGSGLESFISSLANSLNTKVVSLSDGLKEIIANHGGNPHVWLSPEYFVKQCEVIKNTLTDLDPSHKDIYEKNFETYTNSILENARVLKEKLSTLKNRNIITFHAAFPYFAEYFGLNILKTIKKDPNNLPSPKDIAEVENLIKQYNIKVVFKEPQQSSEIYNAIVEDTGVKVLSLNPLGGSDKTKTYIDLMKYNVNTIYEALNE